MSGPPVAVTVVLPAYNEADTLAGTVEATIDTLVSIDRIDAFEVIIAEDGCTDDTPAVAEALATDHESVIHLHHEERLGRGRALERAVEQATGDIVVYFDTDLATDLDGLEALITAVADGDAAIATGSRRVPASDVDRPAGRAVPSMVYNGLVRALFDSSVYDHQCGFKAFDREVLVELLDACEADHWFWDTEVLVLAQTEGHQVSELPVRWRARGDSAVNVLSDSINMGAQLFGLWWRISVRPLVRRYRTPVALLLTLLIGFLVLEFAAEPGRILGEIARVDPWWLLLAAGLYLISWPIRGLRYRDILEELAYTERVGFLTGAVFISQMANLLVPARAGDAVRAYVMKARRNVPYPTGFASLAIERIFDLLAIMVLAAGAILAMVLIGGPDAFVELVQDPEVNGGRLALSLAAGVAIVALIGIAGLLLSTRIDSSRFRWIAPSPESRIGALTREFGIFFDDIRSVSTRPRAVAVIGGSSLVIWSIDVFTATIVLLAFGIALDPVALLVVSFLAVCAGNLAKIVPISPGGIGPYEAAFALVVVGMTPIGLNVAIGAAIVDHALKNLVTAGGGVLSTGLLNVSLVTAVREGQARSSQGDVTVTDSAPHE